MTFEEYMRSDDGKFRVDQFKRRKKIAAALAIVSIVLMVICLIVEVASELEPEGSENPVYDIIFYVSLGVGVFSLIFLFSLQLLAQNMIQKSAKLLRKAVMLFWQEHPIPWENFLKGEEMIVTVDHVYSYGENGKVLFLKELKLSRGDPAFEGFSSIIEMEGWKDLLEGWIDAFLLSSLLPFLEHCKERGQEISLLRLNFACEGKLVLNKKNKDDLYISKGKVTAQAKSIFRVAEILREKETPAENV